MHDPSLIDDVFFACWLAVLFAVPVVIANVIGCWVVRRVKR